MKSVLISIQPKWCELIASGKKTVEVRKTRPKIETPFKCYIYCTNTKTMGDLILCKSKENTDLFDYNSVKGINKGFAQAEDIQLKGKVIGEFVCDHVMRHCEMENADIAEQQSRVKREKIFEYANGKEVFGWHISDLVIYEQPKELREFCKLGVCPCDAKSVLHCTKNMSFCAKRNLKRPPQSWCYVERKEDEGK